MSTTLSTRRFCRRSQASMPQPASPALPGPLRWRTNLLGLRWEAATAP